MIYVRFWIGSAIESVASHVNNAMNFGFNRALQREQNEWNERMAGMANQWNIEQWNRENEYNLPVNQVARLQAAGINPALAMGQGASAMISGQQADAIHPANVPNGTTPPYLPYSETKLNLIAEKLASSEVNKNNAEADEARSRIPSHQSERLLNEQKINESKEVVNKLIAESSFIKQQEFSAFVHTYNELNETAARINNINADTDVKKEEKRRVGEQINTLVAQGKQLIASANYYNQMKQNLIEEEKRNSSEFKIKYNGLTPEQVADKNKKELEAGIKKAEKELKDLKFYEENRQLMEVLMLINGVIEPWMKLTSSMSQVAGVVEKG